MLRTRRRPCASRDRFDFDIHVTSRSDIRSRRFPSKYNGRRRLPMLVTRVSTFGKRSAAAPLVAAVTQCPLQFAYRQTVWTGRTITIILYRIDVKAGRWGRAAFGNQWSEHDATSLKQYKKNMQKITRKLGTEFRRFLLFRGGYGGFDDDASVSVHLAGKRGHFSAKTNRAIK